MQEILFEIKVGALPSQPLPPPPVEPEPPPPAEPDPAPVVPDTIAPSASKPRCFSVDQVVLEIKNEVSASFSNCSVEFRIPPPDRDFSPSLANVEFADARFKKIRMPMNGK